MSFSRAPLSACLALTIGAALGSQALAQRAPSLAGKTLQMIIGVGPGGGYDAWARMVADHIGRHLPGDPTVVPQNMPGAGGFVAAAYLYNIAPKDGTTVGIVTSDAPLGPIFGEPGAQFDPQKMSWLGTPTTDTNICIANKSAKVKTYQDLLHNQLIVGDTGPGTDTQIYPKALNALLGTKFKLITGFPSSSDVFLAMERGEVEGICESLESVIQKRPTWISSGQVNVLFQGGAEPDPGVKAPYVVDLAKTAEQKEAVRFLYAPQGIGRPFVAPPDLPPATLKMLRDAFDATMKDPDFIAETKKEKVTLKPRDGVYLADLIKSIYATPKSVVDRIKQAVND
jgi:tripartite-type tricarboxylate transporter receptor subunit TctC